MWYYDSTGIMILPTPVLGGQGIMEGNNGYIITPLIVLISGI